MTREAELLIDMWDILHRECHRVVTEENYDAIKKAIKVLEQEPFINKPCVSADKVESEVQRCDTCYHNKTEFSICQYCTGGNKYEERCEESEE